MIRRNQAVLNRLNGFADFVIVLGSYLFSSWFRLRVLTHDVVNTALTGRMILAAAIYAVMLLTVLAVMGFYGTTRTRKMSWKLKILLAGLTVSVLAASALFYVIRLEDFSRGIIVIFYVLTFLLLGGKYVVMRLLLEQLRAQGFNIKHEVVIGAGRLAEQYRRNVETLPELGLSIRAMIAPEDIKGIEAALAGEGIDEAVIALEAEDYRYIREIGRAHV